MHSGPLKENRKRVKPIRSPICPRKPLSKACANFLASCSMCLMRLASKSLMRNPIIALLLLCASLSFAQGVRFGDANVITTSTAGSTNIQYVSSVLISVYNAPCVSLPCSILATTYTDSTLGTSCPTSAQIVLQGTTTCVSASDPQGNWGVWLAAGQYCYTVTIGLNTYGPFCGSAPLTPANGTTFVLPITKSAVSHQFITSFTSTTGIFGSARPACSDITNAAQNCIGVQTEQYNTAQSAIANSISATTIFTPSSSGLFRFSYYLSQTIVGTSCSGNTTIQVAVKYQDPNATSAQVVNLGLHTVTTNGTLGVIPWTSGPTVWSFQSQATAIQFQATYSIGSGCSPGPTYIIVPILEQG